MKIDYTKLIVSKLKRSGKKPVSFCVTARENILTWTSSTTPLRQ